MAKLRIGIIGGGQISALHAKPYLDNARARVYAVCDRNEDVAIQRALEWGADRAYTNYLDLLADPLVDAVEILTPHHLHAEMAATAAQAGKHVHLAKPIALNLKDASQVIDICESAGVTLKVSEPSVFYAPIVEARNFMEAGEIGEPIAIHMHVTIGSPEGGWNVKPDSWLWRLDTDKAGGGPLLFDMGLHKLTTSLFFLGPVERVVSWVDRTEIHPGYFLDAPAHLTWKHFGPNRYGSLSILYAPELFVRSDTYPHQERIEITGTTGVLRITRGAARSIKDSPLELIRDGRLFAFDEIEDDWEKAFFASAENFLDAIEGTAAPQLTGSFAKEALRFALAAQRAESLLSTVPVIENIDEL